MISSNYGRQRIYTDILPTGNVDIDIKRIPIILQNSIAIHQKNVTAMNSLVSYFANDVNNISISKKENIARSDINHQVAIPRPNTTVVTINSYCFSNPFKFISLQAEDSVIEELKEFNDACELDNYGTNLLTATQWSGITGIGYKFISKPNEIDRKKGMFFHTVSDIDPTTAFCVYSNDLYREKVMAVIISEKEDIDENGASISYQEYNVFTKWHQWKFKSFDNVNFQNIPFPVSFLNNGTVKSVQLQAYPLLLSTDNVVGDNVKVSESRIPLIEYVRHPDRTNDFEKTLTLIDAINTVLSCSVDAVNENSDYIFKFKNVDIGEFDEQGNNPTMDKIKQAIKEHVLPLFGIEGLPESAQPDAQIMEIPLNQNEVRALLEYLTKQLEESLFVPNRNTTSGGADTNSSVETRNGFRSLEDIAGIITSLAIDSEREFIECALQIAQSYPDCPFPKLKSKDIGIKPMRNKVESLINSTQSFATMINSGVNRVTAYVVSGLVADATDTAKMDELERNANFQELLAQEVEKLKQTAKFNANNSNESKSKDKKPLDKQTEKKSDNVTSE